MRARNLTDGFFSRMLGSPWRNRGIVLSTLACCVLLFTDQVPGEEAVYHMVDGDRPVAAASNGYVQEVRLSDAGGVEVYVETSLAPIGATGSYGNVLSGKVPDVPVDFVLPRNIVDRLRPDLTSWEAATLVLS